MKIKEQIERLRRQARAKAEAVQAYPLLSDTKEMQEAAYYPEWKYADSIESLQAEVERLQEGWDKCADEYTRIVDRQNKEIVGLCFERDELRQRNEKLEAVYEAADRIYNRPAHNQSDEDRLRKALSAVEQIDD